MNWRNLWINSRYGVNQPRCAGVRPSLRLLDNLSGARMATRMLLNNGHHVLVIFLPATALKMTPCVKQVDECVERAGYYSAGKLDWHWTPDMPGGEAAMVELLGRNLHLPLYLLITTIWLLAH